MSRDGAGPGAVYDGGDFTPVWDAIGKALPKKQGGLCAYCMQRIRAGTMNVEHWHCQDRHVRESLGYALSRNPGPRTRNEVQRVIVPEAEGRLLR